jgi:hypothetical protein
MQDIYIARADNELVLEAQLYRALINIYRWVWAASAPCVAG